MTFDSLSAVLVAISFLVPGFVWSLVLSLLRPRRTRPIENQFLEYLTLSCLNHGLWSWALWLILTTGVGRDHPVWSALGLFAIMFLSPVVLGLTCGLLTQKGFVTRLLAQVGFRTIQTIPTAWDWHFSRGDPYWVLVTLKDGSRIHGLLGTESFAGDDPGERDLYLELQFRPTEQGDWAPVEDSGGVLVKADQIALIEFRRLAGHDYGRQESDRAGDEESE